jgi:serine/threonine protein kinase
MSRKDNSASPLGVDKNPAFLLHREGCTIDDYRLIVRIGEGSFGEVWKAERAGVAVALKILKTSLNSEETQREIRSLDTLRKLNHKYLLHTQNFWSDGDRLYIEMELADGGTLKERLEAYQAEGKCGLPEDELLKFFSEAAQALDYLHGQRPLFLHRDIKPANILLVKSCAKLADFGLLRQVAGDNSSTKTQGGTFPYMAPESITSDVFSPYTDLFSLAVTYTHLRQGELPFPGKNQYQICEKILRSSPELADIFHPEEKKVLLKALDKDPKERYASCGEFLFELNRVVPWAPALTIPVMTPPSKASSPAQTTERPEPIKVEDPGTSRKKPLVTQADVELPPGDGSMGTTSGAREDRTVVVERKGATTPAIEVKRPAPDTMPAVVRREAAPTGAPVVLPRRKRPPRTLFAIGAAAAMVLLLTGVWFLLFQGTRSSVHELIANKKYPEALTAIKDANRLFLPSPASLQEEVEEKWFADLREPGPAAGADSVAGALREINQFSDAFPNHEGAKARRDRLVSKLSNVLSDDVDLLLAARNVPGARELVGKYQKVLPDGARKFQTRIDDKEKVVSLLKRSADLLARKDFEGCVDKLRDPSVAFENKDDLDAKTKAIAAAKAGAVARDEAHRKLVAALELAFEGKKNADVQARLAEVVNFRRQFAKTDWVPDLGKYQLSATPLASRLAEVWQPLLAQPVALDESRRRLKEVRAQSGTPTDAERVEENAIVALLRAHESSKEGSRKAVGELIGLLKSDRAVSFAGNLWTGLARLERSKDLLDFDDLDALPAPPADEPARLAAADLYAHVLDRLVKQDSYTWLPDKAQAAKCVAWCEQRIGTPTGNLAAFYAECLLETGGPLQQVNAVTLPEPGDWYIAYVRALIRDRNQKPDEAAAMLVNPAEGSKEVAKTLDLAERRVNSKQATPEYRLNGYRLLGRAYQLALKVAANDLAKRNLNEANERCAHAEKFAHRWKALDLEGAANLIGQAVAIEARAAFEAAQTDRGEARYLVYERALQQARAGGQLPDVVALPVVVAKLDFACGPRTGKVPTTDDCASAHLYDAIADGQAALKLAAAQADARKARRDWWSALECQLMVMLGDVQMRALKEKAMERAKEGEIVAEAKWYASDLRAIRTLYTNARSAGRYQERWKGELAYNLGITNYLLRKPDPAARAEAIRDFTESLKSLNASTLSYTPEIQDEVSAKRQAIEAALNALNK